MGEVAGSALSSSIQWSDGTIQLKELLTKPVPNIIKVTKGQYRDIGVAKSVHNELFIHSIRSTKKVLAVGVKVKDGKRLLQTDQRFSIPITYQGWFELLSEDGKAIKALQSVQDLVRLFPQSCLVRDNTKAFVARENGELAVDQVRVVHAGEMLTLGGEITVPMANGKSTTQKRLLKCFDAKGASVYLGFDQKGMFSPVAGHSNISGVHSIKALITKFRFPILVRLVHGIIPTKVERNFTGVFRLTSVFNDETAFVCPLKKDAKMVPISTREPLKVSMAINFNQLCETEEAKVLQRRCNQMVGSYMNSIHVLVSMPDPSVLAAGKAERPAESKRTKKSDSNHQIAASVLDTNQVEEDILFLEIEDIYHYVREGGIAPPPRPRPTNQQQKTVIKPSADGVAKAMANTNQATSSATKKPTAAVSPNALAPNRESTDRLSAGERSGDNTSGENILWEEPIYEPLDKIREQKKKVQEIEQTIVFEKDYEREHAAKSPSRGITPQSPLANLPVSNLRQVIQQNRTDMTPEAEVTRRPKPLSPQANQPVPPLPPKNFKDKTKAKPSSPSQQNPNKVNMPRSPQHHVVSPPGVVNISIHEDTSHSTSHPELTTAIAKLRSPNTLKKRRAPLPPATPISSPSSNPLTTRHNNPPGAYNPGAMPRSTNMAPSASRGYSQHGPRNTNPPYVAVARVGDAPVGHTRSASKVKSMRL